MKEFVEYLREFDHSVFFNINHEWVTPLFDQVFTFITTPKNALYFIVVLFGYIFFRKPHRAITILLGCVLAVGLADSTATYLIKHNFQRDRPEFSTPNVRLIVPSQGSPSFPSNHAANSFAVATFLSYALPETFVFVFIAAAAVAYSRVYVGVHYPLDIIGGAILGILCGLLSVNLMSFLSEGGSVPNAPAEPQGWKKRNRAKRRTN